MQATPALNTVHRDHVLVNLYRRVPELRTVADAQIISSVLDSSVTKSDELAALMIKSLEGVHGSLPDGFDPDFYLSFNKDVRDIFNFPGGAQGHYLTVGRSEGRPYNAALFLTTVQTEEGELPYDFDERFYLWLYKDVADQYDYPNGSAVHYLRTGRSEGRLINAALYVELLTKEKGSLPPDFDEDFYVAYNIDVARSYPFSGGGGVHYIEVGRAEGRAYNADRLVEDMERLYGSLPDDFDEAFYTRRHRDVSQNFRYARAGAIHYLTRGREERRDYCLNRGQVYNLDNLNLSTNRIFDLPQVVVHADAPVRVNVLVPAFEFASMSAGFFGVFQVARFIKSVGFNVRLVLFDNFYWDMEEFRSKIKGYPGMESLLDELELAYIGERLSPLVVSPYDNCVATVWYSAYFADKIMSSIGGAPFLYLIQDYETNFYPGSSLSALADASYDLNFCALFSSQALQKSFVRNGYGNFGRQDVRSVYFNNACASTLVSKSDFMRPREGKKFVLYSRPVVHRNMFELAAISLCEAIRQDVFGPEWTFYGIGLGEAVIELGDGRSLKQLPRMNLRDYQTMVANFDLGLSLMASPHPSLLPFDLGGSGAIVVTNTYGTKNQGYFDDLCGNVLARAPRVPDLVQGLKEGVERSNDRSARYEAASTMAYPKDWEQTFHDAHKSFIKDVFRLTLEAHHSRI